MEAYARSKTPPEDKDERETPPEVFQRIQEVMGIEFIWDSCASEDNTKLNGSFWGKEDDALSLDWMAQLGYTARLACVWMNPPYSNPGPWCRKAAEEARKGLIVVGLLPDDRSTDWYQQYVEAASTIYVPDRRISFLLDGKPQTGNPKGSVFPVWTPWGTTVPNYVRFTLL